MSDKETSEGVGTQIGVENGKVLIMFSEKLNVVGYSPKGARKLAKALRKHADAADTMSRKKV